MRISKVATAVSSFFCVQTGSRAVIALAVLALALLASPPVTAQTTNAVPLLNQPLLPDTAGPGAKAFTLTVTGSGFVSTSVVNWNGSPRTTTFVSSEKLTAAILATDVAKAGSGFVTVTNPAPGGGTSNAVIFPISKAISVISMIRNDIPSGSVPMAIVAADFNNDGKIDLAVANASGNSVSVYLGNGNGTFQTPVNYQTATGGPSAMVLGDFNGDGKLDLAVALQRSSQVSILLGNGDGTFGAHQEFSTGLNPVGLAVGDVNNDGKLDLLVANKTDSTVSVLLGKGDGTFQGHVDYATGINPEQVAVGDFNGDGALDLAVPNNNDNTVSILLNSGSGTFPTHTDLATAADPTGVAIADFNGDGILDLAVSTASFKTSVLLGTGGGAFKAHADYAVGANSQDIAVGDLSAQGKLDIVVANFTDNSVSVLPGNGKGGFTAEQVFPTNAGPGALALGDFMGTGKLGIAVANTTGDEISLLTNTLLSVTPTYVSFPIEEAGIPSAPISVTVKNGTASTVDLATPTVVGTDAAYFGVASTSTCSSTLLAGASCTIPVAITPPAKGVFAAQVIVTETNGSSTGFGMTGNGQVGMKLGPTRDYTFKLTLEGTNSAPAKFVFTNVSGINITLTSIITNGQNASDFLVDNTTTCGTTVLPNASCNIFVTYHPTTNGQEISFLNVFGSFSPGNGQQAVQLNGTGTAVKLTPTSLTFPAQTVGTTSAAKTITFFNAGSTPLIMYNVNIQGTNPNDFHQTSNCPANSATLAGGATCTISVTFTPQATGSRTASLMIGDNDWTGPQTVPLAGTGK
jgi:FG-GAP-like repeat/FG-GAP repeat